VGDPGGVPCGPGGLTGLLQAVWFLVAVRLGKRFGLLPVMVFTHLPSNLLLAAMAFAPGFGWAAGLWLARVSLSLTGDPALMRLAKIVHAADIAADLGTDPAGPGLLAIGLGGLDVEDDDYRLLDRGRFVYDALYAWCQRQVPAPA